MYKKMSMFLYLLYLIIIILTIELIFLVSIPFWSDSKKVCEYWEKQNEEMVCIQEKTIFCLERECSNESRKEVFENE